MRFWVYIHTCPNGKRYVGVTTASKPERRWLEGRGYQNNDHFYRAILKYGWDNFEHKVFEVDSAEEMYRKEVELISFYHSNDPEYGYNHSSGGEKSALGCIRSEETKRRMSETAKERWSDPEVRRKRTEANKKSHSDPEFRRKISEARKGKPRKPFSEEARKHMAEAAKKSLSDPEVRKKMSEIAKKSHADPEYRKKLSEAHKKKWLDPEFKERMSKVRSDPEVRKHISEAAKNRPKVKISLPDGTILEISKSNLTRHYVNKGKKFEYVD